MSGIPTLFVREKNLPAAWEKAILAVWDHGVAIRTEYDRKDAAGAFLDPPSRDCTMVVEVEDPFAEPRIHKNFPGGPEELEVYRQEVVAGIHDHWVDPTNPEKWTYTYHGRLFSYEATEDLKNPGARRLRVVDQMDYVVRKLAAAAVTRRAQAITWIPNADPETDDPPCLQRLWFRLTRADDGSAVLSMNSHWRSRDAYKAWFMNAFALTDLMCTVADAVGRARGEPVAVGRYVDIGDSFHVYGSYFRDAAPEVAKMKADPDYRKRSWDSDNPAVAAMFEEARARLARNPDYMRSDPR